MTLRKSLGFAFLGCFVATTSSVRGGTSQLWGEAGELFDPRGRLPDYSWAGYHGREKPIPELEDLDWPVINVMDHGAVPDDGVDDLEAITLAIEAAPENGAIIFLPKGEYTLESWLNISRGNLVLQGEGDADSAGGGTVIYCPYSSDEVNGSHLDGYHTGGDGFFITFSGVWFIASQPITEEARRGDRTLTVTDGSQFSPGMAVVLVMSESEVNGTLWDHLHNYQVTPLSNPAAWTQIRNSRWGYTVERVERNLVTLREPLRLDVRREWTPALALSRQLQEIGVQDLRMKFALPPSHPVHLKEPGYNGIRFEQVRNSWIRNVTFENADNGITFGSSSFSTAQNIKFVGRAGHHGLSVGFDGNILGEDLDFSTNDGRIWFHAATLNHQCQGSVISRLTGSSTKSLDLHANTPFESLYVEVTEPWSYNSSGDRAAQPHTGARTTYWNLAGLAGSTRNPNGDYWGDIQTNLIGDLSVPENLTPDREWYEQVEDLRPVNLYEAQLEWRRNREDDPPFAPGYWGDRKDWFERDPSRWRVKNGDDPSYQLHFGDYPSLLNGGLGEYALPKLGSGTRISGRARTREDILANPDADIAFILGYRDDRNYLSAIIRADSGTRIVRIRGNSSTLLAEDPTMKLADSNWHDFQFVRRGEEVTLYWDNTSLTATAPNYTGGRAGIGSEDDSVEFDDVSGFLTAPDSDYASWISVYALSESDSQPGADPDADGQENLLEFAFGLDPLAADPAGAPAFQHAGGEFGLVLQDIHPAVTYQVEISNDMVEWRNYGEARQGSLDAPTTRMIPDSEMLDTRRLFVRVRVTE